MYYRYDSNINCRFCLRLKFIIINVLLIYTTNEQLENVFYNYVISANKHGWICISLILEE